MTYRHVSNLRVPFDRTDLVLIAVLPDYRLGEPVAADPAKVETAMTLEQLKASGIVGLYLSAATIKDPLVQRITGWSEKALGRAWQA